MLKGWVSLITDATTPRSPHSLFGAIATDKQNHLSGIVGDDGLLYLSGVPDSGKLEIRWGHNASQYCQVNYQLPASQLDEPFCENDTGVPIMHKLMLIVALSLLFTTKGISYDTLVHINAR